MSLKMNGGDDTNQHILESSSEGLKYDNVLVAKIAFDAAHPVGSAYVQYPNFSDPNVLWGSSTIYSSTWELQSYNGAFFRASGGMANGFNSGLQSESIKAHQHGMQHYHDRGTMRIYGKVQMFRNNIKDSVYADEGALQYSDNYEHQESIMQVQLTYPDAINKALILNTNANNGSGWTGRTSGSLIDQGYGGDKLLTDNNNQVRAETAPANYTIQIWKRTA